MIRKERFTFVLNTEERALIASLAALLQRSQSDTVRSIVLKAARELIQIQPVDHAAQGVKDAH